MIVDADQQVHVSDIVNPSHMFVADTFDCVSPEADVVEGWALDGLNANNFAVGKFRLEAVGRCDGACAAHERVLQRSRR